MESASYNRTEQAKRLVGDDFWRNEIRGLIEGQMELIANSSYDDHEGRERAYIRLRAIQELQAHFESLAASDVIAKKRLKIL
jgi:hypothetical protein